MLIELLNATVPPAAIIAALVLVGLAFRCDRPKDTDDHGPDESDN